ncbi:hypothetical protein Trydic_g9747 [Trypoxylus dichotomus]
MIILNIGSLNAFLQYVVKNPEYEGSRKHKRKKYLKKLLQTLVVYKTKCLIPYPSKALIKAIEQFIVIPKNIPVHDDAPKRLYLPDGN